MSKCSVASLLSLDGCTINIVEVGHPVPISISNREWQLHQEKEMGVFSQDISSQKHFCHEISAKTVGNKTGNTDTHVKWSAKDTSVIVQPVLSQPDDYSLEVFNHGEHIQGSPFTITAVERGAFDYKSVTGVVETGEEINFIIPMNTSTVEDVGVSVQGPLGACDTALNIDKVSGTLSVGFNPQMGGDYVIDVTECSTHVANYIIQICNGYKTQVMDSPIQMCRTPSEEAALKCHILEEDMTVFTKPQRFSKRPTFFHISMKHVLIKGELRVECNDGPAQVHVTIEEESKGERRCGLIPAAPGKYSMDILWNGRHIRGSPFNIVFHKPKTKRKSCLFMSDGLDLKSEHFRIGVPHRFKLSCAEIGSGNVEFSSQLPSAANVSITKVGTCVANYQCEIVPREIGEHEISLKYDGKHIQGSPFKVCYRLPGDASQCSMVGSYCSVHLGGNIIVQISAAGAGKGKLQAGAEDTRTHHTIPVSVRKTADHIYQLEFQPGPSSECLLAVKYDYQHIPGSPFKLRFDKQGHCRAEGKGLISAQAGEWNKFSVYLDRVCLGSGALWVNIEGADGEIITPAVSNISPTQFEISYMPHHPGNYTISIKLGTASIPGSPFRVRCYGQVDACGEKNERTKRPSIVEFTKGSQPSYAWVEEPSQDTQTRKATSHVRHFHIKEAVTFL